MAKVQGAGSARMKNPQAGSQPRWSESSPGAFFSPPPPLPAELGMSAFTDFENKSNPLACLNLRAIRTFAGNGFA